MIHVSGGLDGATDRCPVCRHHGASARPLVTMVDTGEELPAEILRGAAIAHVGLDPYDLAPGSRPGDVVAICVPRVDDDGQVQLRIPRSFADSSRASDQHHLAWENSARPANTMVLPPEWFLLESSVAAIVTRERDGRTRIEFDAPADASTEIVLTVRRCAIPRGRDAES
jgi:hypothetical protein